MSTAPHRIRKQRWRVRARSQAEAFALRTRLRQELDDTLQPALARVFDEIAPGDEVLHLPRLEIHARVASLEELAEVLPELVRREIHDRLRAASGTAEPGAAWRRTSAERSRLEALIHYLETGMLPWPVAAWDRAPGDAWAGPLPVAEALAAAAALHAARFERTSSAPWFRLLQLVSEDAWAMLARAVAAPTSFELSAAAAAPADGDAVDELAEALAALPGAGASLPRHARLTLAAAAIAAARTGSDRALADLLAAIVAEVPSGARPLPELIARLPERARPLFERLLGGGATFASPASTEPHTTAAPPPERRPAAAPDRDDVDDLAEAVAALAGAGAALSRHARLTLAAAAIAAVRAGSDRAVAGLPGA